MGNEVSLDSGEQIIITIKASINPDIDLLDRIELIEQGDVINETISDNGSDALELSHALTAEHGTWFVVRAYGKNQQSGDGSVAAISAPIYVSVDGQKSWKKDQVVDLANKMKFELDQLSNLTLESAGHLDEWFETRTAWTSKWSSQHKNLQKRIKQAKIKYDELIKLATKQ